MRRRRGATALLAPLSPDSSSVEAVCAPLANARPAPRCRAGAARRYTNRNRPTRPAPRRPAG
eukprot:3982144-Pyramimonas_sp.AAC.1